MAAGDLCELRLLLQHIQVKRSVGLGFVSLSDADDWMAQLLDEFQVTVAPVWTLHMHREGRIDETEGHQVTGTGIEFVRLHTNPQLRGVDTGQISPHQCAALIRWTTGLSGRSNRGRSYLWLFSVYHVFQGQELLDGLLERMQALIDIMLSTYGPSGSSTIAKFVVISRTLGKVPRDPPIGVPITGGVPISMIATQRSRIGPQSGGG